MIREKTDISKLSSSFILVTAAVLFIYSVTGMTAAHLNAVRTAVLFGTFVSFCAFYALGRIKGLKTGFIGLVSGIPAGVISKFALDAAFNSVNRMTIECFGIMVRFLLWGGIACILLTCVLLVSAKCFKTEDGVFAVLAAGFVLRTIMVVFTPLNFYQHDVSGFGSDFQGFHDDYIMFIYEHWTLPANDIKELGQLYHPPLHHVLSAVFFKINSLIFPKFANEINVFKTLPFLYSCWFVLIGHRILKHFKIDGAPLVIALAFISLHPQLIFLSIQINNDALMTMLFAASFYIALKWYEKPELTTILFLAISIGCAMMAKLSGGLVAIPVAFLFLLKLIDSLRKKKGSVKLGELIKQFVLFAILVFPLGLWYQVKNYILFGTPITYVWKIESTANQDLWMFPTWQRLFAPSAESLRSPFMAMNSTKPEVDYNIFLSLLKSSLFDERTFDNEYLMNAGQILLILSLVVTVTCICCAVFVILKLIKQKKITAEFVSLVILCATLCISYVNYCIGYPITSTESFRFVIPVLLAAGVFLGMALREMWKKVPPRLIVTGVIILFIFGVIAFYGSYAGYRPAWEVLIKPA